MSRTATILVIGALVVFGAVMTWLHYREIALIDSLIGSCSIVTHA
jgi:hypothetical protein